MGLRFIRKYVWLRWNREQELNKHNNSIYQIRLISQARVSLCSLLFLNQITDLLRPQDVNSQRL